MRRKPADAAGRILQNRCNIEIFVRVSPLWRGIRTRAVAHNLFFRLRILVCVLPELGDLDQSGYRGSDSPKGGCTNRFAEAQSRCKKPEFRDPDTASPHHTATSCRDKDEHAGCVELEYVPLRRSCKAPLRGRGCLSRGLQVWKRLMRKEILGCRSLLGDRHEKFPVRLR